MVVGSFGWVVPVQGNIVAFHFIVTLALVAVYGLTQPAGWYLHHKSRIPGFYHVADRVVRCNLYGREQ